MMPFEKLRLHRGRWRSRLTKSQELVGRCRAKTGTRPINTAPLTLADGAVLGFNFTQKKVAPVLDLTDKTVTMNGEVKVKVIVLAIKSTGIYILVR